MQGRELGIIFNWGFFSIAETEVREDYGLGQFSIEETGVREEFDLGTNFKKQGRELGRHFD